MSQSRIIYKERKPRAQVLAFDPGRSERHSGGKKYINILRLSDLLSRNLETAKIIEAFTSEIRSDIPHTGYLFGAPYMESIVSQDVDEGFEISYRLNIQGWQLGKITFFRQYGFSTEDLSDLEDLLCALVHPLKNAMMYQTALNTAYQDPLTDLSNRTSMEKFLPREIELAKRHEQAMALLVMDLDGFKQINDNCGHDVGDQVLRNAGEVMHKAMRNTDLLYRYGGDEFVAGLPHTDINGALDVGERIRAGVEKMRLPGSTVKGQIKMSVGVTIVKADDNLTRAFKRADKALYQAKQGGKNRIEIG